ncbi:hypothetical protein Aperf_G00000111448 [Anoplocephala perfoliata]
MAIGNCISVTVTRVSTTQSSSNSSTRAQSVGQVSQSSLPADVDVDMEVDFSLSTVHLTGIRTQPHPQTNFSADDSVDVDMESASITSDNMEISPIFSSEPVINVELDKENVEESPETMASHASNVMQCSITSFLDAALPSETPENAMDDLMESFSNVSSSQIIFSNDSLKEMGEVESLPDTSTSSYSNPLSEINCIRPTPVVFDNMGCVDPPPPLRVPLTGSLSTPFPASARIWPKRVNTGEQFSLSLPGKSTLSFARDKAFTKGILMSFDIFRTNPPRALDSLEIDQPPVVARQQLTMQKFMNDLLELDVGKAIVVSSFESYLKGIIPVEKWINGKLDSVSEKYVQRFVDDLLSHYQLIEADRSAELQLRMGQSAKPLLTENAKSAEHWTNFLEAFNQLTIEKKIRRINSLRDHFYNQFCEAAERRMLTSLTTPVNNIEHQLREQLNSLDESLQARKAEIENLKSGKASLILSGSNLHIDLDGWLEILENDAIFIAIKKAREGREAIEVAISEVMEERKELRTKLESLGHHSEVLEALPNSRQLSTSDFVGLGTSLITFGPPVPQSRILDACRRLFRASELTCLSAEENIYEITTIFGLIVVRASCECDHQGDSGWSAWSQVITDLEIRFRRDPTLLNSTNQVGECAFQRLKENWKLVADNLTGRRLEDAVDFLEYALHSYILLATCLRALHEIEVLVSIETNYSWKPVSAPQLDGNRNGVWRSCRDFYVLGKALSFTIPPDSRPFKLTGIIAPKNSSSLLKTELEIYSVDDLFNPEKVSSMKCKDLFGESRLDLLRKLPLSARGNIADIYEHLIMTATKSDTFE